MAVRRKPYLTGVIAIGLAAAPIAAHAKPRAIKAAPKTTVIAGDAAAGAQLFKTSCSICHGQQAEGTPLAPTLRGVVGSKAGATTFPRYTPALKASGLVWSPTKLDVFLSGPPKLVPGTAMAVTIAKAEDRKNLIAHLATLKK